MPEPSSAYQYEFEVISNSELARDTYRLRLLCPELAQSILPGQFVNIFVPGDPSEILRLPFSWSVKDAKQGWVEIANHLIGPGTVRLSEMKPGTRSNLLGPCGKGWSIPSSVGRVLLVGGGSGFAPLVPLIKALREKHIECDVVQGAQTGDHVIYARVVQDYGADFILTTDDGSAGLPGFATLAARELFGRKSYDYVYTCGPTPMMRGVAELAHEHGAPCQVSLERMMACGFGVCGTCAVDTRQGRVGSCMKGPVFDAEEVLW